MTEITFNQSYETAEAKILIATKEEDLNYGAAQIIDRSTFNRLKALIEREDTAENKKDILVLDMVKEAVVLLRIKNTISTAELEELGGKLYSRIKNFKSAAVYARKLPKTDFTAEKVAESLAFGIELASYSFDKIPYQKETVRFSETRNRQFCC